MIELYLWFVCNLSECHAEHITVTREALAIMSCESGDGWSYGTFDFTARNRRTHDGGAFQFNDKTAEWLTGRTNAETWEPATQYAVFLRLWDDGAGWKHWKSSKPCWERWLLIDDEGRAVWIQ